MVRIILIVCLFVSVAASAHADMFKYRDDSGTLCMTNKLESVPKKFRKKMTVVKEESSTLLPPVATQPTENREQATVSPKEPADVAAPPAATNRERYIRTGLVLAGCILLYFVISRICAALSIQKIGTVVILLTMLGGGVYLYGLYIEEMRAIFSRLRSDSNNIKKNVETREQKSDSMLKQIGE